MRFKTDIITYKGEGHTIQYVDSEWISLHTLSVIIRGSSIAGLPGINTIEELVRLYDLDGMTNGRLLILECQDSFEKLITILADVFLPEGLNDIDDFVVFWNDMVPDSDQYEEMNCVYEDEFKSTSWLSVSCSSKLTYSVRHV